jgi:hypothetical protein
MKPPPQNGFIPIPITQTGFQPNHQFNSSMQVPPTHVQNNPVGYQFNPNNSMTTPPNKYFPPSNQVNVTQTPLNYVPTNFTKPIGPYFIEQRSPNHQSFNSSLQMPVAPTQQINPNLAWKKG